MPARLLGEELRLLVLVRHGEAESGEVDPDRPLTAEGRRDVQRMTRWLSAVGVLPQRILHSRKRRAEETAEILQTGLRAEDGTLASDGLRPKDDVGFAVDLAERTSRTVLLVGHLPHLERVVDALLVGKLDASIVELQAGGAAILAGRPHGWTLRALMQPDLLPPLHAGTG